MTREVRANAVLVPYLREHGPTPSSRIPVNQVDVRQKLHGVCVFRVTRSRFGSNKVNMGRLENVVYIAGEHSKQEVVEAWLRANPRAWNRRAARHSTTRLMSEHGPAWRDAYKAVVSKLLNEAWQEATA